MAVYWKVGQNRHGEPLDHPRIGWRRIEADVAASSEEEGYEAVNASTYRTDSFWRPTASTGWLSYSPDSQERASYCGIAAHDLGSKNATIVVEYSQGGGIWVQIGPEVSPENNSSIMVLFTPTLAWSWRVRVTSSDSPVTIAVIQFGEVTELPRKASYSSSVSFERARNIRYRTSITEGGQFAGRSIQSVSLSASISVDHLSEDWMLAEGDAFISHAERNPFFVADRPESYPKSVLYGWTSEPIIPSRVLPNRRISNKLEFGITGFLS